MSVKWSEVKAEIDKALEYFDGQGIRPSLRTLYYRLVSVGILPHSTSAYKTLSRKCVEWRMAGHYAWDFLQDATRITLGHIDDNIYDGGEIEKLKAGAGARLNSIDLDKILDSLFDDLSPYFFHGRWATQPNIVEAWVEKEALAQTLSAWLRDKSIIIRVNRGYSSWTFIYNNVCELRETIKRHDKVVILYLGDHDPSGLDIDRFLAEALAAFRIDPDKVEFQRFALTQEQINRSQLPPIEVNVKDSRAAGYIQTYGDRAWELDALLAYAPEKFKKELRKTVDSYFDKEIAERVSNRASELADDAGEILEDAKENAIGVIKKAIEEG
ncbi:hypothetical protein ES703_01588 [subsurface metagenome]